MSAPPWQAGPMPAAPPPCPIFRFPKKNFWYKLHLLGDARVIVVHYHFREGTKPCWGSGCTYCTDLQNWKTRSEGYAAAYLEIEALADGSTDNIPIVAAFTDHGLVELGPPPHRGLKVRAMKATSGSSFKMKVAREKDRLEPFHNEFDVDAVLMQTWYPKPGQARVELPPKFRSKPEKASVYVPPPARTLGMDDDAKKLLAEYCSKMRQPAAAEPIAIDRAEALVETPPPVKPPARPEPTIPAKPPKPSTNGHHPRPEVNAIDATLDEVLGLTRTGTTIFNDVVSKANGHHPKGGAQ